jgi:hypothetical protein
MLIIKKFVKRIQQHTVFFLLLSLVLMGSWCVPPKWTEKVIHELKAKYIIEKIEDKDS